MPCHVCGQTPTVKSHLLPKSLIREIYAGHKHAIAGSRFRAGPKPTQGGEFSKEILCAEHEAVTATFDTYATNFVRWAQEIFEKARPTKSFKVANPRPEFLAKFALATIWREVHAAIGTDKNVRLGPYDEAVRDAVFGGGSIRWPMLVSRANFTLETPNPIKFAVAPYRIKFADRHAWSFTVVGFSFFVVSDGRGISKLPEWLRADLTDPTPVIVGHQQDFRDVKTLRPILDKMFDR